jgi:hypothetical protein
LQPGGCVKDWYDHIPTASENLPTPAIRCQLEIVMMLRTGMDDARRCLA